MVADHNPIDVPAQNRVVPNAGGIPQRHIAHHDSPACDIDFLAERRFFAQERVESRLDKFTMMAILY